MACPLAFDWQLLHRRSLLMLWTNIKQDAHHHLPDMHVQCHRILCSVSRYDQMYHMFVHVCADPGRSLLRVAGQPGTREGGAAEAGRVLAEMAPQGLDHCL